MFKVNRKVEYALMALKHMDAKRPGELTSAKEICDFYGSPFDATSRVLQVMAARKLLKSEQGAFGGYLIVRDLKKVSLYELMSMILGQVRLAKCLEGKVSGRSGCELEHTCNIKNPMQIVNAKLSDFCKELSIFDVIHPESVSRPNNRTSSHIQGAV